MLPVGIFEGKNDREELTLTFRRCFSAYDYVVPARGRLVAQTDIQIAVPENCYGRIGSFRHERERERNKRFDFSNVRLAPRSGLAAKFGIDTGGKSSNNKRKFDSTIVILAGVIDADYRGNVGIVIFNHNDSDFTSKIQKNSFKFLFECQNF